MQYFGFYVVYNNNERVLSIDQNVGKIDENYIATKKTNKNIGKALGYYYETDIKTYLDGNIITAYNTNGTTWIWAEEMRDFGYDVIWDASARTLSIYSLKQLGYQYSINISNSDIVSDNQYYDMSKGCFSVLWKNNNVELKDDAKLFNTNLYYDGISYRIELSFYQGQGLFYSETLQNKLDSLVYKIYDEELKNPKELYEVIDQYLNIKINGNIASQVAIQKYGGNGHRDYYIEVSNLPKYTKDEIKELEITLKK